ncbi:hypothetical protein [Variovorax sp. tm]|uniref:hypothetical protein n=1 Tax=Variovorax atrisoli TaxID=3394203 RepID=UPI003A7FBBC2
MAQKHSHSIRRRAAPDFSSIRTLRAISWGADELFFLIYFDRDGHCARFNDRNMKHILVPKSTNLKRQYESFVRIEEIPNLHEIAVQLG